MSLDLGRNSSEAPSTPKASTDLPGTPQKPLPSATPDRNVDLRPRLDRVLQSDIGINTLLTRLKQSISSARDFAVFLKERAAIEERHATAVHRLTRGTSDVLNRADSRRGTFAFSYHEVGVIHERMAKNSEEFSQNLLSMAEELQEVAAGCERGRKNCKHTGLEAEMRAQDADSAMEKAKQRYYSLAEQYDRVRTGERQGGKFGLKKSAAQQEESSLSKAESADQEYKSKVEAAQAQRHELLTTSRPQAIKELQNLIMECDAMVSMQLQRFAVLNEKLLLGNGLCVSPLKGQENGAATGTRSLRELAQAINNQKDFDDYVLSHSDKVGNPPAEIRYDKHPALASPQQYQPPPQQGAYGPPPRSDTGFGSVSGPPARSDTGFTSTGPISQGGQTSGIVASQAPPHSGNYPGPQSSVVSSAPQLPQIGALSAAGRSSLEGGRSDPTHGRSDSRNVSGQQLPRLSPQTYGGQNDHHSSSVNHPVTGSYSQMGPGPNAGPGVGRGQVSSTNVGLHTGPPSQIPYHGNRGPSLGQQDDFRQGGRGTQLMPSQGSNYPTHQPDSRVLPSQASNYGAQGYGGPNNGNSQPGGSIGANRGPAGRPNLPPLKPVFGVPLDELFRRDGAAVPAIVYQCVQAVDLFGLQTEGVYRVPGSAQHVMELQAVFDHDASQIDFRNRGAFYNDIASVTTLLKHFLRDLPDPLLTSAQYNSFIQAAKIDEDIVRRDSLHAIINSLPDPNYATLRTLTLHLNRVARNSAINRMTTSNLAIVFGPTLMGGHGGGPSGEIQDAGWQARVIETILNNTLQIFDDDD